MILFSFFEKMGKIKELLGNWMVAVKTFPLTHLIFLYLTVLGILEVNDFFSSQVLVSQLFLSGGLALIWSLYGPMLSLHLKTNLGKIRFWNFWLQIFSLLVGVGSFFWFQSMAAFLDLSHSEVLQIVGCFLLSFLGLFFMKSLIYKQKEPALHVSISTFVQSLAFWGLASLILFAGIAGTFASIEALFDVDFSSDVYKYLGVICSAFLFGSFALNYYTFSIKQFLAHWTPEEEIQLSRVSKFFGLYIFLPISLLYLAIFLAYGLKILFTGVWPKGVLVWMGVGYVVGVLFTYYLTYFHQSQFVEKLRKMLFVSFFVIGGLMSGAIALRVLQYGITLDRYFVMMFILFVFFSALGILIWKKRRILIWISLFTVFSAISFFGPFSAKNITRIAQKTRLEALLLKNNLYLPLGSGSLANLDAEDGRKIYKILNYFFENYPSQIIESQIFDKSMDCEGREYYSRYACLQKESVSYLGLENMDFYVADSRYFYIRSNPKKIDIKDYAQLYFIDRDVYDEHKGILTITLDGVSYTLDLNPHFPHLEKFDDQNPSELYEIKDGNMVYLLNFVSFHKNMDGKYELSGLDWYLLLK